MKTKNRAMPGCGGISPGRWRGRQPTGGVVRRYRDLWQALELYRALGYPSAEADILNGLGEVALAAGDAKQVTHDRDRLRTGRATRS